MLFLLLGSLGGLLFCQNSELEVSSSAKVLGGYFLRFRSSCDEFGWTVSCAALSLNLTRGHICVRTNVLLGRGLKLKKTGKRSKRLQPNWLKTRTGGPRRIKKARYDPDIASSCITNIMRRTRHDIAFVLKTSANRPDIKAHHTVNLLTFAPPAAERH